MSLTKTYVNFLLLLLLGSSTTFYMNSCKKDQLLSDSSKLLLFSTDTLTFDTVFTTLGTTTKYFKIINPHNQNIEIIDIHLKNAGSTTFRLNIDGVSGNSAQNIIVPANDSIYVFVAVTVNPGGIDVPFIYSDDVEINFNGNTQSVNLMAWGQDAYFHYGEIITSNTTWLNNKPHVLVSKDGIPGVLVSSGVTLNIPKNTHIYGMNNTGIYCWGTLNMGYNAASCSDTTTMEGIRLESYYDNLPGQWGGINMLRGSTGNFKYVSINESSYGIFTGSDTTSNVNLFTNNSNRPSINLESVIISNTGFGQFANGGFKFGGLNSFNSKIRAVNSVIYNSTGSNLLLILGGDYKFYNCTFYNGGSVSVQHQTEVLLISNFIQQGAFIDTNAFDNAEFNNCIVYGSLDEELSLNKIDASGGLNVQMNNCNIKTKLNTDSLGFVALKKNISPAFIDAYNGDFHLSAGSPCVDAGFDVSGVYPLSLKDFCGGTGSSRPIGAAFDIGAFEY